MQPEVRQLQPREQRQRRQIIFLLDVSASMRAADPAPSRLTFAKKIIRKTIAKLEGDQFGLIVFSNYPYLQCPLTEDEKAFEQLLELASPEQFANQGTEFRGALQLLASGLERLKNPRPGRYGVLLTDGGAFDENYKSALIRLRELNVPVIPVPIGTERGARIPLPTSDAPRGTDESAGSRGFVRDETGTVVISKLETELLNALAEEFSTPLIKGDRPETIAETLAKHLRQKAGFVQRERKGTAEYVPAFKWITLIGILFLLLGPLPLSFQTDRKIPLFRARKRKS